MHDPAPIIGYVATPVSRAKRSYSDAGADREKVRRDEAGVHRRVGARGERAHVAQVDAEDALHAPHVAIEDAANVTQAVRTLDQRDDFEVLRQAPAAVVEHVVHLHAQQLKRVFGERQDDFEEGALMESRSWPASRSLRR